MTTRGNLMDFLVRDGIHVCPEDELIELYREARLDYRKEDGSISSLFRGLSSEREYADNMVAMTDRIAGLTVALRGKAVPKRSSADLDRIYAAAAPNTEAK